MTRALLAGFAVLGLACINPSDGILVITIDSFDGNPVTASIRPTQTMSDTVLVEGVVTRAPPMLDTPTDIAVTGGAAPVTVRVFETGRFRLTIPMRLDQLNQLTFTAEDVTGAQADPVTLAVTHVP